MEDGSAAAGTLVVAATRFELETHPRFPGGSPEPGPWELWRGEREDFLACGPGPALAGAGLGWALGRLGSPRVLGLGIAGAFDGSGLRNGDVRWVAWEAFGDLGAEDGEAWLDFPALALPGLPAANRFPLEVPAGRLGVGALTVSAATGSEATARARRERHGADLESMEGAAWALACRRLGTGFAQLRAVSNRAGRRDRSSWDIPGALAALRRELAATV